MIVEAGKSIGVSRSQRTLASVCVRVHAGSFKPFTFGISFRQIAELADFLSQDLGFREPHRWLCFI